jgi:hypothetical protein
VNTPVVAKAHEAKKVEWRQAADLLDRSTSISAAHWAATFVIACHSGPWRTGSIPPDFQLALD